MNDWNATSLPTCQADRYASAAKPGTLPAHRRVAGCPPWDTAPTSCWSRPTAAGACAHSHWAANTLETDLLPGPGHAVRLVRAQRPAQEWLDQRWGEGGLLLDLRRRVVLFFFWHLRELPVRAAVFAVPARTWPGWEVRWAYRGLAELRGWVGHAVRLPPVDLAAGLADLDAWFRRRSRRCWQNCGRAGDARGRRAR
ncbi:hypothetical protein N8J89_37405 [Crossiella sp. CA-258035]|uniref:hypothetical protein n=1 Tax=Crossiella sp. CA-258035 TaxID=2981138 RepID=UPI0024BCA786|nr:hypothetical protein [Crossiella sp. CA-258035]WHT18724.1 hypothetical protein N8J89_37405 [Crossiella sp. CA-258035]